MSARTLLAFLVLLALVVGAVFLVRSGSGPGREPVHDVTVSGPERPLTPPPAPAPAGPGAASAEQDLTQLKRQADGLAAALDELNTRIAALEAEPSDLVSLRSLESLLEMMEDWRGALELYESEVEILGDACGHRRLAARIGDQQDDAGADLLLE